MSIVSPIQEKESPKDYIENINSIFNSKLFLYLDINNQDNQDEENEINNPDSNKNNESNIDEKEDFEEINYLSNELIKELNNCTVLTNENNDIKDENKININIINSLVSLAKNGYEFKPKNYKQNSEKERIEQEVSGVEGTVPSTKGQIELYQKRVNYYRSKGCNSNDIIGVTCDVPPKVNPSGGGSVSPGAIIGENGFRFPVNGGRISWGYGGGHKGVDITRGCGTPIYAIAPGRVYYVGNGLDNYGAYMVLIVHNVNGRLVFSQYAHVQPGIPVYVGQSVDTNTVVAYMGSTGYSTGCHLHLEMSRDYGWAYNGTYSQYVNHITSPWNYVPSPY